MAKQTINPKQSRAARMHAAPRCGARARTRGGEPCQAPAVRGKARCRMHGGKGSGAPKGNHNAWKHGARSAEMMALEAEIQRLIAEQAQCVC